MDKPNNAATRAQALLDALPLTAIVLVVAIWWLSFPGIANSDGEVPPLERVEVASAEQLEAVFAQAGYFWPADAVPPLTVQRFPDDLSETAADTRKSLFFRTLLPLVLAENERIADQRHRLHLALGENLPEQRRANIIRELAAEYKVEGDPLAAETWQELARRVNTVPVSLALAQAAKESGWGTSRFAREGNNLFGEWTWTASAGLKPEDRPEGATHYVQVFDTLRDSVRSYLNNLNTHAAYERFRFLRHRARGAGREMTPMEMTAGLVNYSERRWAYVEEVREMIVSNQLHQVIDGAELAREPARIAFR